MIAFVRGQFPTRSRPSARASGSPSGAADASFLAPAARQWQLRVATCASATPSRSRRAADGAGSAEAALVQPRRASAPVRRRRLRQPRRPAGAGARRDHAATCRTSMIEAAMLDAIARLRLGERRGSPAQRRAGARGSPARGACLDLPRGPGRARGTRGAPVARDRPARPSAQLLDRARQPAATRRRDDAHRAADRSRARRAAIPADEPLGSRDRRRADPLGPHGQDPHAKALREARRAHARRGRAVRARARAAGSRQAQQASINTFIRIVR